MAKRKGVSPVIATVIIVAVTIAIAIAVAFWMTGLIGLFTGAVEKLEIVSASATPRAEWWGRGWQITVVARNTGTTQTTIDSLFINGIIAATRNPGGGWQGGNVPCLREGPNFNPSDVLKPGDSTTITFTLSAGECGTFNAVAGISIEVKLHTTGGREYPKLLNLP